MSLRQHVGDLVFTTNGRGLYEITADVADWLGTEQPACGLMTLFIRHTSASLLIQENADPDVLADLERFFARLVADDPALYRHTAEGPDDMPAHIRTALTATQLAVPVREGALALGTWQGIFLYEHRTRPHRRQIALHYFGE